LPFQQRTIYEIAKALEITVPQALLTTADEIIE
jgi:hypothetical protein